ncbi:hypothetical protein FVE85_4798 [Porphyridium purpureum]|uniref:Uncharacterized protein n=1 Tax=Porphyridium purpureum TaxID=35688 RepID=A0A5J4YQ66_PORPP|nr:hypothetical protein FVE85_4609 [Porphyridium purpureum]KAA8493661.1 hypothetical protein FVE85_4798 [Porphyridium purpureum]|eukprot:POR4055..scf236_6
MVETQQGDKSIEASIIAFDSLCSKILDMRSAVKLDRFVWVLNERLRIEVLLRQPSTHGDGLTNALAVDSAFKTGQRRVGGHSLGGVPDGRVPVELGATEQTRKKKTSN